MRSSFLPPEGDECVSPHISFGPANAGLLRLCCLHLTTQKRKSRPFKRTVNFHFSARRQRRWANLSQRLTRDARKAQHKALLCPGGEGKICPKRTKKTYPSNVRLGCRFGWHCVDTLHLFSPPRLLRFFFYYFAPRICEFIFQCCTVARRRPWTYVRRH